MNNNDIMRSLRYAFDFSDSQMIDLFDLGGAKVTRAEVSNWMKREDDPDFESLYDRELATLLNGLIVSKRGKKDGDQPVPEKSLNNNIILRKLKIALSLKDDDMLQIMKSVDFRISKHEVSAFFRNPSQSQFRPCKDQVLRNFLRGIQIKFRGEG